MVEETKAVSTVAPGDPPVGVSPLIALLRCLECAAPVRLTSLSRTPGYPELGPDGQLTCEDCGMRYPLIGGTARMLPRAFRGQLAHEYPLARGAFIDEPEAGPPADEEDPDLAIKRRTADSFTYEWRHFGDLREQWRKNFIDYMQPLEETWFLDRYVIDVGTGSGRHAFHAAKSGAQVVAVDLGASIDVARRNLPPNVLTVQADAEHLPLATGSFDLVMSIGVLHLLPDPMRALRRLAPLARPGGHIHVYLYWVPERSSHRRALRVVTAARRVTVRMPHRLLHAVCLPLAAALMVGIVVPYRVLRRRPRGRRFAEALPLKTYADYPFGVLVNDQFDRFSPPLERRFTREEVEGMLKELQLEHICVRANHGWVGDGLIPEIPSTSKDGRPTVATTQ
jgi:ubiquinone/menaquinone biosynthesis C-methylase UbiE/uncharacterized protein YbaR (Trm112 family)